VSQVDAARLAAESLDALRGACERAHERVARLLNVRASVLARAALVDLAEVC
jgi:hypothetical protein